MRRYLGLLEVIRIRKAGYPVRMPHMEFVQRYRILYDDLGKLSTRLPTSAEIAKEFGLEGEWQVRGGVLLISIISTPAVATRLHVCHKGNHESRRQSRSTQRWLST